MEAREQSKRTRARRVQGLPVPELRRNQKVGATSPAPGPATAGLPPGASPTQTVQKRDRRTSNAIFLRSTARRMLAEGASAEEVATEAGRLGLKQLTPGAITRWIRSSTSQERAMWQEVKKARKLKQTIEAAKKTLPPGEFSASDARLAKAAQFTGLASPVGAPSSFALQDMIDIQNALCGALGRENALLKQRALKLEVRREAISRRIERARIRLDRARWETVQRQLGRLADSLRAPDGALKPKRLADRVRDLCRLSGVIE